jgi:hypothetical protein
LAIHSKRFKKFAGLFLNGPLENGRRAHNSAGGLKSLLGNEALLSLEGSARFRRLDSQAVPCHERLSNKDRGCP